METFLAEDQSDTMDTCSAISESDSSDIVNDVNTIQNEATVEELDVNNIIYTKSDKSINENADRNAYSSDEMQLPIEKDNLLQSAYDAVEDDYASSDSEIVQTKTTPSGMFTVSSASSDGTAQILRKKLTSKQRRAVERASKRKKIGSNFYEVTNVKNRNRNRKIPKIKRK